MSLASLFYHFCPKQTSGEKAKGFFLQSSLPPQILAEIWNLSDINKDGKLDKREFSISCFLIKKVLTGTPLPASLPASLLAEPSPLTSTPIMFPSAPIAAMQPQTLLNRTGAAPSPVIMQPPLGMSTGFAAPVSGASPTLGLTATSS
jgi:hypothetical protein